MSIRVAISGSEDRRWRRARSISPWLDNGFITLGKSLANWLKFLLLFLVVVLVVGGSGITVSAWEESELFNNGGFSSTEGEEESFLIFWGRIGILVGLEGFGESSVGDSVTEGGGGVGG